MFFLRPKFVDSPYFVGDFENWHLLPGAPKELRDEFNEFMEAATSEDFPDDPWPIKKNYAKE
jgi:hypothetical protein